MSLLQILHRQPLNFSGVCDIIPELGQSNTSQIFTHLILDETVICFKQIMIYGYCFGSYRKKNTDQKYWTQPVLNLKVDKLSLL